MLDLAPSGQNNPNPNPIPRGFQATGLTSLLRTKCLNPNPLLGGASKRLDLALLGQNISTPIQISEVQAKCLTLLLRNKLSHPNPIIKGSGKILDTLSQHFNPKPTTRYSSINAWSHPTSPGSSAFQAEHLIPNPNSIIRVLGLVSGLIPSALKAVPSGQNIIPRGLGTCAWPCYSVLKAVYLRQKVPSQSNHQRPKLTACPHHCLQISSSFILCVVLIEMISFLIICLENLCSPFWVQWSHVNFDNLISRWIDLIFHFNLYDGLEMQLTYNIIMYHELMFLILTR